jgi:hypothetical protein
MTPQDHQNLEQLVNQAVRDLPARRAPSTLEGRVQAELARRMALPWWRKSYVDWPLAARATFAVCALGVVKLVLMAAIWVEAGFDVAEFKSAFAPQFQWLQIGGNALHAVSDYVGLILGSIPPLWLYGGVAIIGALYITLFGLGAAAYRTLQANSN